ncbi:hypothetical protein ACNKHN_10640 [Shigella flexneri]
MNINYPAEYEIGDIVFTCIGATLFGQISLHQIAGVITSGSLSVITVKTFWLEEAGFPSTITTLSRFI